MICAQAVVHFRPRESYEKYLKLIVSVMILLQLFLPIGGVLFAGEKTDMAKQLSKLTQSMEEGRRLAEEKAAETEAMLEQMTLEEVQRRIEAQAQQQNTQVQQQSVQTQQQSEQASSTGEAAQAGFGGWNEGATEAERTDSMKQPPESIQVEPIQNIVVGGES